MAFYYVKNGGTAGATDNGRATVKRTGTFAAMGVANYYDNIETCIEDATTRPANGDFILASSLHDKTYTADSTVNEGGDNIYTVVCVDDANAENQSTGAIERTSGSTIDITYQDSMVASNMEYQLTGDFQFTAQDSLGAFYNCKWTLGSNPITYKVGSEIKFVDCEVDATSDLTIPFIFLESSTADCVVEIFGGAFNGTDSLINTSFIATFRALIVGIDLSSITGTLVTETQGSDPGINLTLKGCKLNASLSSFYNRDLINRNQVIRVVNSSSSSATAEYQYYLEKYNGIAQDNDSIFRDQSQPYLDSNQKVSIGVVTNGACNSGSPFILDFEGRFSNLASGGSDTVRIFFTSTTALTDSKVWAQVTYPDGTIHNQFNTISNADQQAGTFTNNPIAVGTTHTTDGSSTWTGGLSNLYFMDVDTSGAPGRNSGVEILIFIGIASTTIYFDTQFEMV